VFDNFVNNFHRQLERTL